MLRKLIPKLVCETATEPVVPDCSRMLFMLQSKLGGSKRLDVFPRQWRLTVRPVCMLVLFEVVNCGSAGNRGDYICKLHVSCTAEPLYPQIRTHMYSGYFKISFRREKPQKSMTSKVRLLVLWALKGYFKTSWTHFLDISNLWNEDTPLI